MSTVPEPLDTDDVGAALREGSPLHTARRYRRPAEATTISLARISGRVL